MAKLPLHLFQSCLVSAALAWALSACGGSAALDGPASGVPDASGESAMDGRSAAARRAAWTRLEQQPGVAGTDYDPRRILLVYRPDAVLPAGWAAAPAQAASAPAPGDNPLLRQNARFGPLTAAVAARHGLAVRREVYLGAVNLASFDLPAAADGAALLQQLRAEAGALLETAVFVPLKRANYVPNDPDLIGVGGTQWSHHKVKCPAAWDVTLGSGNVIVAVVDTGVRLTHEELAAQVINPQVTFPAAVCDLANNDKSIEDSDGHGTFIAGMVCAEADNGRTIAGVAPQCRVLPIKISNGMTAGVDDLIAGALLAGQLGARAVNYSWGGYDDIPAEEAMVNQLTANGVLFVCAAGNDGSSEDEYPADFVNAFTVGATDKFDAASDFSNWGLSVDIAAPGQQLKSCAPGSNSAYDTNGEGTSYAAPMVAAAAGLLWSYDPSLSLAEVRQALQFNGPSATGFMGGIRRLDIDAALDSVYTPAIPSISGLNPLARTTWGVVPRKSLMNVSVSGAVNVARVEYTLDCAPLGPGAEDRAAQSTTGPAFATTIGVEALRNQIAVLRAEYFSSTGESAGADSQPLWIFNQRGDLNGDGAVDQTDLLHLQPLIGVDSASNNYRGYIDSDLDGMLTEADGAPVGYNWGVGALAPDITAVAPQTGYVGVETAFTATVAGSGMMTYAWDFGGGASPNTSDLPAPTVTLGAAGSYNGSLLVTSEFGLSDSFTFTLTVGPRPGPAAMLSGNPLGGPAPLAVEFDASGSSSPGGSIVQYDWSWDGDATWEATTASPINSHVFQLAGDSTVRLRVTDDMAATAEATVIVRAIDGPGPLAVIAASPQIGPGPLAVEFDASESFSPNGAIVSYDWSWDGDDTWEATTAVPAASHTFPKGQHSVKLRVTDVLAAEATFTLSIHATDGLPQIGGWGQTVLGPFGRTNSSDNIRLASTLVAGRPAVVWAYDNPDSGHDTVMIAVAKVTEPQALGDWSIAELFTGQLGRSLGICAVNGKAGYIYETDKTTYYGVYGAEAPAHAITPGASYWLQYGALATIAGRPAVFSYSNGGGGGFGSVYAYADSAVPGSNADWNIVNISGIADLGPGNTQYAFDFKAIDGKPYVSCQSSSPEMRLTVCYSSSATPAAGSWSSYSFPGFNPNERFFSYVFNSGGRLQVIANRETVQDQLGLYYGLAGTHQPSLDADWTVYEPLPAAVRIKMAAEIGGLPAYGYEDSGPTHILLARQPEPADSGDWIDFALPAGLTGNRRLVNHGGYPALFAVDPVAQTLVYRYPEP